MEERKDTQSSLPRPTEWPICWLPPVYKYPGNGAFCVPLFQRLFQRFRWKHLSRITSPWFFFPPSLLSSLSFFTIHLWCTYSKPGPVLNARGHMPSQVRLTVCGKIQYDDSLRWCYRGRELSRRTHNRGNQPHPENWPMKYKAKAGETASTEVLLDQSHGDHPWEWAKSGWHKVTVRRQIGVCGSST